MIPYIEWKTIELGPLTIQVWGMFVALGFLIGAYMATRLAIRRGQNSKVIYELLPWLIFAGLLGGRLGYVVFYDLAFYLRHPLEIFALWHGGSSIFGGFIACFLVGMWFFKKHQLDPLAYADTFVFGLPFGLIFGRLGCFLIHDHPGTATDFILGMRFPDGVVRHDLGLEEALMAIALSGVFLYMARHPRPIGSYAAVFCVVYGGARFYLDFYRLVDVRYLGLTPAQYLCLFLMCIGVGLLMWIRKRSRQL
jgi:phosphatidylglycerol---prolipoprotein diacylglyceryl transferase